MESSQQILGIGDLGVSGQPDCVLKTFGLGSCVALMLYDRQRRAGGMVHVALPDSTIHGETRVNLLSAGYYGDRGTVLLLRKLAALRGTQDTSGLVGCLVGGASTLSNGNQFLIGERNVAFLRDQLFRLHIPLVGHDVGGTISRTVWFDIGRGTAAVTSPGRPLLVLPLAAGTGDD